MIKKEIWKPVKEFENAYMVSNLGRVKTLRRRTIYKNLTPGHWTKEIIKKPSLKNGYYFFLFRENMKCKNKYLHRIIAEVFIKNPKKLKYVDHKDGNKLNNSIENLRWCTHTENCQNSIAKGFYWHKKVKKWHARIKVNKKQINLGLYSRKIDAINAYKKAKIRYFKSFAYKNN